MPCPRESPSGSAKRSASPLSMALSGDLTTRFGISGEAARHDLLGLLEAGLLERLGGGSGTHYVRAGTSAHPELMEEN